MFNSRNSLAEIKSHLRLAYVIVNHSDAGFLGVLPISYRSTTAGYWAPLKVNLRPNGNYKILTGVLIMIFLNKI
jgi:hypothetical protein